MFTRSNPVGVIISARPVEEPAGTHPAAQNSPHQVCSYSEAEKELTTLELENPGCNYYRQHQLLAQAFPERVFGMVPAPGFERVPPAEKRMRDDKFTVFLKRGVAA